MVFPSHTYQQLRTAVCFPPFAFCFLPPMSPFLFSLFTWWILFLLIPPLFAWSDPICLRSSFLSHLTFSLSSLTLSFIICICPLSVYFVHKFNNFFTPFIYSSSSFCTVSSYFSFYFPPIWKYSFASTLGIWHPFALSSVYLLHSYFDCLSFITFRIDLHRS